MKRRRMMVSIFDSLMIFTSYFLYLSRLVRVIFPFF